MKQPETLAFTKARFEKKRVFYNPERISLELLNIAEEISKLTGTWNPVEIYTPSPQNVAKEKARFMQSFDRDEVYQPAFIYDLAENMDVSEARATLEWLKRVLHRYEARNEQERLARTALIFKINDDLATCLLVEGIQTKDEKKIKRALTRKYPPIDETLLTEAHRAYAQMTQPSSEAELLPALLTREQQQKIKNTTYDADQIQKAFEWLLRSYSILRTESQPIGFRVVISDRATAIDVRDKSTEPMTIYIPSTRKVDGYKLLQLMTHEIEGHARQSVNGIKMFKLGGGSLRFDNETLYEGLAMRLEGRLKRNLFGVSEELNPPWLPPFDILAMEQAMTGASFAEIFKTQFELRMRVLLKVPQEQQLIIDKTQHAAQIEEAKNASWSIVYRVMRGHVDMSNPEQFAMYKDAAYGRGYLIDLELSKAGYAAINEMGIVPNNGLRLVAELGINETDIPHPFQDLTTRYCFEVMLPSLETASGR